MTLSENKEVLKRCITSPIPSVWELIFGGIAVWALATGNIGRGWLLILVVLTHWIVRAILTRKSRAALGKLEGNIWAELEAERLANGVASVGWLRTLAWLIGAGTMLSFWF